MRHAILGAGGVGGTIGACLAHSGEAVTMVVRPSAVADYPRCLRLEGTYGKFEADAAISAEVPACDVLWITVKATQLESALGAIVNPVSIRSIVPLLNGIDHLALLRSRYGVERVIAATIAGEMERTSPGHFAHRTPFLRLNVASAGRDLLAGPVELLQKIGLECRFIDDEPTLMWSKLVFLAPFALTTTAADRTVGGILSDPEWRDLGLACVREASAVAVAESAKIDAEAVIAAVTKNTPPGMRSSMQKDVEQGREPELDAIAGPILRGALRHGIDVSATKKLVKAVERRAGLPSSLAS